VVNGALALYLSKSKPEAWTNKVRWEGSSLIKTLSAGGFKYLTGNFISEAYWPFKAFIYQRISDIPKKIRYLKNILFNVAFEVFLMVFIR
jgi:hypothetical protein